MICENLGISINEFFGIPEAADQQKGKKIADEATRLFTDRYFRLNEYHRQVILREMDVLIDMQEKTPVSARKLVQIYRNDLAACAGPSWGIGDESGEPVWLYEDSVTSRADEIIRVSGDSMEPRYHDGDQVLVQKQCSPHVHGKKFFMRFIIGDETPEQPPGLSDTPSGILFML